MEALGLNSSAWITDLAAEELASASVSTEIPSASDYQHLREANIARNREVRLSVLDRGL